MYIEMSQGISNRDNSQTLLKSSRKQKSVAPDIKVPDFSKDDKFVSMTPQQN
jgi:hypothetical protein